jgi:hypothetical protein
MFKVLQSGHLYGADYDPDSQTLAVQFQNGAVYHARGVPQTVADSFFQVSSPGSFWHDKIKTGYAVNKVSDGATKSGRRSRRRY